MRMRFQQQTNNFEKMDFARLKTEMRALDDTIFNLGTFQKANRNYGDKTLILQAIDNNDYETLSDISEYFYNSSGIYQRLCKYLAFLYRYDWYVTPFVLKTTISSSDKMLKDYTNVLNYFDNSNIKKLFGNVALEVMKKGSYYGYITEFADCFSIQQLPSKYCRVRYYSGIDPVVELKMNFFDNYFTNINQRLKILALFPKDVQQAYAKFKQGKLKGDTPDEQNWYALDPALTVKFCLNNSDFPPLCGAIPSIIDLDQAQDLDRKKTMQQLLKIIIQKLPLDKNGDMIFDMDEMQDMHSNAVNMLRRAVGVDVLTTVADIDVADMRDSNSTTKVDDLSKVERTVFNNLGVSQNLFNTEGNLALEKSIANDEATMRDLLLQFQRTLNKIAKKFNKPSYSFKINILETTIYNYKEISKMYKEQTQIGFSKLLPQIALGHLQSDVIASIQFENQVLHLQDIMIPPLMSSTMSSKNLGNSNQSVTSQNQENIGRPEKSDDEKSEKTIANRESM